MGLSRKIIIFILLLLVILIIYFNSYNLFYKPTSTKIEDGKYSEDDIEIIAENLKIPWEMAFLPDNEILITERSGRLLKIADKKEIIEVQGVKHIGEGGLLGLALHPDFANNHFIYLYFTSDVNGKIENRVERYVLDIENNLLKNKKVIIANIPGASYHDGGRIAFGPDNKLYITTGDAGNADNAQNINSLAGKILRVNDDGSLPEDNPFNNEVYSYGHRNSQGLSWDDQARLWSTEHGRSGVQSGLDELNIIIKGKNYGWPVIEGDEINAIMETPIINSGPDETWAPSGSTFFNGKIYFTGLRGESLYEYDIANKTIKSYFHKEFGRLRAVAVKDDYFYILTSNLDGRGNVRPNDDKIIRIKKDKIIKTEK